MKAKNIVKLYYVLSALRSAGMGMFMGVYSNFLRSGGLDEFWVNMVNVSYFVVITICEIPTGIFADIFGRKGSFVISCFLDMIAFTIYGFSRSFSGFVLAESIGAVGQTFASGAFDSWLVDSLKHNGEPVDLIRVFSRRSLISRLVIIVASIFGGQIADHGLNLPFFVSSLIFGICGLTALIMMKETYFVRSKFSFVAGLQEIRETWKRSIVFAKMDVNFRFILIISAVQLFAFMAPNMEWQKVFSDLGLNNSWNGIIGALINVAVIIGVLMSGKIGTFLKEEKKQLVFTLVFIGLCITLTVTFVNICPIVIFFFLHEVGRGATGPVMDVYTHKCITISKERATLCSFGSMVGHFGGAFGLIVSGLVAKYAGITSAWILSGTFLIIATLVVARNHKR